MSWGRGVLRPCEEEHRTQWVGECWDMRQGVGAAQDHRFGSLWRAVGRGGQVPMP